MPQSIQQLKDQGPLPQPTPELWPGINPYHQKWIPDEIGADAFEKLLQLPTPAERKIELAELTAARVEKLKSESPVNTNELLGAMQSLGDRLKDCGRGDEAQRTYGELLKLYATLDKDPKDDLRRTYGLADVNFCMGNFAEAERLYRLALPYVSQPPLGVDSPQYLGAWRTIVEAVARQGPGKLEDARGMLEEGFEMVRGMRRGSWWKFEGEEREAMEEVREMVNGLGRGDRNESGSGSAKL